MEKDKLERKNYCVFTITKEFIEKHPDNYRFTNGDYESNYPKKGQRGFQKQLLLFLKQYLQLPLYY